MPINVKNTTFPGLLDLITPHSCRGCGRLGDAFCECCKKNIIAAHKNVCPNCKQLSPTGNCPNCQDLPPIYVVSDRNGILGTLIHDYKYSSVRAMSRPLADLINNVLPNDLPKNSILVPLPTATHHVRARGMDHTLLIAKNLSKLRHFSVQKLLLRAKNTVQVGSDREKRLTQASSAYTLNPKIKIDQDATYILLDDIWTTGASTLAAKNLLEKAGAKKIIISLLAYSSNSN